MMGSRTLLNWSLLLLLLGLAWGVYLSVQDVPESEVARVSQLRVDEVKVLRLQRDDAELVFERDASGGWRMTEPVAVAADSRLVDRALAEFSLPSQVHYPALGLDFAKYGLERPPVKLDADGLLLEFGRSNPLNGMRYVLIGNNLHMVAESDISFLQRDWPNYVSRRLISPQQHIQGLRIEGLGACVEDNGHWRCQGSQDAPGEQQIQALVERWQSVQALTVERLDDNREAGVDIWLTLAGVAEPVHVRFVRQGGRDWLVRPGLGLRYQLHEAAALLVWDDAESRI